MAGCERGLKPATTWGTCTCSDWGGLHVLKHLSSDDPKVYTKPFTVNLTESLEADTDLIDEFFLEGEKDYDRLQRLRGK